MTAAVVTGSLVASALILRRTWRDVVAVWVGATALTLVALDLAPSVVLVAVAVTAATGLIADELPRRALLALATAAAVVAVTPDIDNRLALGALATTAVVIFGLSFVDRIYGHLTVFVLIAGTAFGIYINVPDTEQIAVVATGLGLLAAAAFFMERSGQDRLDEPVVALLAALVMSAGAVGARGEVGSFVGVAGAVGVFAIEPIAFLVRRRRPAHAIVLVVVHAAAVVVASRVAGVYGPRSAWVTVAATVVATFVVLVALPRRRPDVDEQHRAEAI